MKMPRVMKRHCPTCRSHSEQKIIRVKAHKRSELGRVQRRRSERLNKGYGGRPYNNPAKSKRHNVKTSKRPDLRFECSVCKKQSIYKSSSRTKKFELA